MSDMTDAAGSTSAKGWFSLTSSALTAVVVGFASTILIIMQAADKVGANEAEKASWAASLCIGQAIITLVLSWRYKMPIIAAWSTPGAALIGATTRASTIQAPLVPSLRLAFSPVLPHFSRR